jgi:hypothetical protein
MAKNDHIRILSSYSSIIPLGDYITFEVNLANLVLKNFGPYTTVKLESDQLGSYLMNLQPNSSFTKSIHIPAIAINFPSVNGEIAVYEGSLKLVSSSFEIFTTYESNISLFASQTATKVSFTINASVSFTTGTQAILNGNAFIKIYKDHLYLDQKYFTEYVYLRHTMFFLDYYPPSEGIYRIEAYLMDGINKTPQKISEINYTCTDPDITSGYRAESQEFYALLIPLFIIPSIVFFISLRERFSLSARSYSKTNSKTSKFKISLKLKNLFKKKK